MFPWLVVGLALVIPVAFALLTGQAWEDFFISFRHSVNLVQGQGLTYQAGERIQGFSSPFAVLLGALAWAVTGEGSFEAALWILRFAAALAAGLSAWFLCRALDRDHACGRWPLVLALLVFALESKSVAFAANGMETPFFVLFLTGALWSLELGNGRAPLFTGCFWAGLLWTRPDGCVYIALLALASLLIPLRHRPGRLPALLKSAAVCAILYLPWFLFAWLYYGSPIPQTVIAKEVGYAEAPGPAGLVQALTNLPALWALTFLPPYSHQGDWVMFRPLAGFLGMIGSLVWLVPRATVLARRAALVACGALVYLAIIGLNSPWYFPPILALTIPPLRDTFSLAPGRGTDRPLRRRAILALLSLVIAGAFSYLLLDYARLARVTTELIERNNRQTIGLWLRAHARPRDRVFLECPGIIGYYSGLKMLDYPGLVSPEVSDVVRRQGRSLARAGLALSPEWMVLRPRELRLVRAIADEDLRRDYAIVQVFDQTKELQSRLPDRWSVLYDSVFIVLRRRDVSVL